MKAASVKVRDELAVVAAVQIVIVMKAAAAQQSRPLSLEEDALEGLAELRVENAVDDWIEGRVGVAEPRQDLECRVVDAGLAKCRHDVDAEKRHPANCAGGKIRAHKFIRIFIIFTLGGGEGNARKAFREKNNFHFFKF